MVVHKERLVYKVHKGISAKLVHKDLQSKVYKDLVFKVPKERKETKDLKVLPVIKDIKVSKVHKEIEVTKEYKVHKVDKAFKD
jgi:hypothetical protein